MSGAGKQPPAGANSVQVFGLRDSRTTQKAQRFFKERRVPVSYVDLARRPLAAGELRRFVERFGGGALVDRDSRAFRDAGLAWQRIADDEWPKLLLDQPRLLRLPLVRAGNQLAVGEDEPAWRAMVS